MSTPRTPHLQQGWQYRTDQTATAANACVDLGQGARLWVGPDDPHHVVAFEANAPSDLARLADLFGRTWMESVVSLLGPGGVSDDPTLQPPTLDPVWARLAVVLGVIQWSTDDLDPVLLMADEGLARRACGQTDRADALLRLAADSIVELAESEVASRIGQRMREALQAVRATDRVEDTTRARAQALLAAWTPTDQGPAHDVIAKTPVIEGILTDPRYLSPRVVEEAAVVRGDRTVQVWVQLTDYQDADTVEASSLAVSLVSRKERALRATTGLNEAEDGILIATLPVSDEDCELWLYSADLLPDATVLDAGRASREHAALDRWMAHRRQRTSGGPSEPLLAELAQDLDHDQPGLQEDINALLDDASLERVLGEWALKIDLAPAFSRNTTSSANLALPLCDRSGEFEVADLEQYGINRRGVWELQVDEQILIVRLAIDDTHRFADYRAALVSGHHATDFITSDDSDELSAQVACAAAAQLMIRISDRARR